MVSSHKRTLVNVACSVGVLVVNVIVSFFLSPYIVKTIGVEANGFVTLANNFVTYANLIVTALNSMAARFITIEYVRKNYKKANLYYNSVFWGNLIIVVVLLVPAVLLIVNLQNCINVPSDILWDVKLLLSFVFLGFFLSTGMPNWDCGVYVTNRLDRQYVPTMMTAMLRCVMLFLMLTILTPHVWYVGFASAMVTVIGLVVNWYNTKKLTPELHITLNDRKPMCSRKALRELVGSGLWNSISNVGNMLLSGLDLIICNMILGATSMGVLSLSKILPTYMQQMSSSICSAFAPELVINYAKDDRKKLLHDILRAMKLTSVVMTIPIAGIIVLGDYFFALWVPSQDAHLLQILSILSILGYMFTSGTQILYNVFSTVNKVKQNSIAMVISGVVSVCVTLLIANFTEYGLYAVAGVSTAVNLVRNMSFTLPATARYLGFKWYQFFPQVGTTVLSSLLLVAIGFLIKPILPGGSWLELILSATVIGVIGLVVNIYLVLNAGERRYLFGKVRQKLGR